MTEPITAEQARELSKLAPNRKPIDLGPVFEAIREEAGRGRDTARFVLETEDEAWDCAIDLADLGYRCQWSTKTGDVVLTISW